MSQLSNLTIRHGNSYKLRATLTTTVPDYCTTNCSILAMDLTDKTIKAQIRQSYDSDCAVYEFDIIEVDAENGVVDLFLPASVSAEMKIVPHVWDMTVTDDTNPEDVFTAFYGSVTVTPSVTR